MARNAVSAHLPAVAPRGRGFTLLELLVVIAIIGIVITVATLSIGVLGEDRELETETERLTDVVALALEQSQLEGRDYGLRFEDNRYRIQSFDGRTQRWLDVADDPWFRERRLPAGVVFGLTLEGRRIVLRSEDQQRSDEEQDKPQEPLPQVILFASGDVTPYELVLSRPGTPQQIRLVGGPDGTIEVQRDSPP